MAREVLEARYGGVALHLPEWTLSLVAFLGIIGFPFALLSDTEESLCRAFDVIKVKKMYGRVPDTPHQQDFIECVKTREKPFRDIEFCAHTMAVCHLGLIAYELKRSLKWDQAKQEFLDDEEANRLVNQPMRPPWRLV